MDDSRIVGAVPEDSAAAPVYRVIWPVVGTSLELTLLADHWTGLMTHWEAPSNKFPAGRSVLCDEPECEHCRGGRKRRWLGYIACWCHSFRCVRVAVCGWEGAGVLLATFPPPAKLRGVSVNWVRTGKTNKAPVYWGRGHRDPPKPLPPEPDIIPTLIAMLGPNVPKQLARRRGEEP